MARRIADIAGTLKICPIPRAGWLTRSTMANIKQYLFFAFANNAAGIAVQTGGLYALSGLLLSPVVRAAAMSFGSVSVVSNPLRLRGVIL